MSLLAALTLLSTARVHAASSPVVAWGDNTYLQCKLPSLSATTAALGAGSSHSLAIKDGGLVVAWGAGTSYTDVEPDYGQAKVPSGLSDVVSVCGGFYHTLALKRDGTLVAWGFNDYGQTNIPSGIGDAVAIAAGGDHNLVLRADGRVAAWGDGYYGQIDVPADLTNAMAVSAGYYHSLALRNDGSVVAWGRNNYGQATVPEGLTNVLAIAAGGYHCLALKSDGTVVAWGAGTSDSYVFPHYGQCMVPTNANGVVAIAAGHGHSLVLKTNGTMVAWGAGITVEGQPDCGQAIVPATLAGVTGMAAGDYHSLALKATAAARVSVQPTGKTMTNGHPAVLRVLGAGSLPLNHQWRVNGTNIAGANAPWLLLPAVTTTMATNKYSVAISNASGTVVSSTASFTVVDSAPVILTQPSSWTLFTGALARPVTLFVNADGTWPLSYQWARNGAPIAGATQSSFVLPPEMLGGTANYTVLVTNAVGARTSQVACVSLVAPQGHAATVLADRPLAYWRLGEKSGDTARDAWHGYDGNYVPSVTLGAAGAIPNDPDTAVRFAGGADGGYVAVPWTPDLNVMPPFSVECWAKPASVVLADADAGCPLGSIRRVSTTAQGWVLYQLSTGWNFRCGDSYNTRINIASTSAPTPDTWYHLLVTYDGLTAILYINGQPAASGSSTLYWPNPSVPLSIGARGDGYFRFNGVVDDVALYDRVLSPRRVQEHFYGTNSVGTIGVAGAGANLSLTWDEETWQLQAADDAGGPYTDVPAATSPWTVLPVEPQKFYRLRRK